MLNQIEDIVKKVKELFGNFDTPSEAELVSQSLDYLADHELNICEDRLSELKLVIWLRNKVQKTNNKEDDYDAKIYSVNEFD